MKTAAAILSAALLALGGLGLAGCSGGENGPARDRPGLNEKPPQPTTGTKGTKAPTPPAATTTTG